MERFSSESSRGRARLPQRRCVADFMVRSPEYSPLRPYQSSSEDSSSEHSSSSSISSPGREKPTEIPKLCPPPYGFHFGAQKKGVSHFPSMHKNTSTSYVKAAAEDGPLSPQAPDMGKCFISTVARSTQQRQWQEGTPSPRSILKPPPPYTRLVRTPSLKEYPNHAVRLLPREVVSEELKSWHQRNQLQKLLPSCGEQQSVTSPISPHLPPFAQVGTSTSYVKAAVEDALICLTLNILMHWSCYFRKLDQWFQKCGLGYCKGTQVSMCAVIYIKSQVKLVVGGG